MNKLIISIVLLFMTILARIRGEDSPTVTFDAKESDTASCNVEICPPMQGVCYEDKCICAYGFKTVAPQEDEPLIKCNYRQKSHMVAFFLEFFFPVGIGHLYAEKITLTLVKFSIFAVFFVGACGQLCCLNLKINKWIIFTSMLLLFDLVLWIALQIVDIICYVLNYYLDGNGIRMI